MNWVRPAPPTEDKRWKIVDASMRRLGYRRDALIEALHSVQETFGYLDDDSLRYVAQSLRLPLSAVYGAATFYHFFTLKPPGKHACVVCTGTACHIKGAPQLLEMMEREYQLKPGETTPDGRLSLLTARCVGSCGLAPVVVLDRELAGNLTPDQMRQWLERRLAYDT
jgi:bidirectional [NiFe] hydrogenase diaphorase subunit